MYKELAQGGCAAFLDSYQQDIGVTLKRAIVIGQPQNSVHPEEERACEERACEEADEHERLRPAEGRGEETGDSWYGLEWPWGRKCLTA